MNELAENREIRDAFPGFEFTAHPPLDTDPSVRTPDLYKDALAALPPRQPDFFRYIPWEGEGYKPVGYGVDSVSANLNAIHDLESKTASLAESDAVITRRARTLEGDRCGWFDRDSR